MSEWKVRVGVIGVGSLGQHHARIYAELPGVDLVGVYDANRASMPPAFYHAYKIVFLCEITGGEARPSSETIAVDLFSFDDLPPLSTERTDRRHLAEVRAHAEDPQRRTAFD